jgi:hypothetical protein
MSGIIAQNVGRHTGLVKASSGGGGAWTLIQTLTSDGSDSDLSFTSGIDSTYDEYVFIWNNMHPETDSVVLTFNGSSDGGSNYNVTKTSTMFRAAHYESDASKGFSYETAGDLAQSTGFQYLMMGPIGNDNDQSTSGYLHCFGLADTTFVKQFYSVANTSQYNDRAQNAYMGGYFNTTSAIDAIQFKMTADEIQGGSISMYGIS